MTMRAETGRGGGGLVTDALPTVADLLAPLVDIDDRGVRSVRLDATGASAVDELPVDDLDGVGALGE